MKAALIDKLLPAISQSLDSHRQMCEAVVDHWMQQFVIKLPATVRQRWVNEMAELGHTTLQQVARQLLECLTEAELRQAIRIEEEQAPQTAWLIAVAAAASTLTNFRVMSAATEMAQRYRGYSKQRN